MIKRTLRHIRLPSPISYVEASRIQESIVRAHLDAKSRDAKAAIQATVLTMEMAPVYTTGRRDRGLVTTSERTRLKSYGADVVESLRGGQTTFHGPGQLVAYPILDLSVHGVNMRPKCYVDALEQVILDTLSHYGLRARRTENTGVWVTPDRKIAAIGVHLRRHVTSHGIALNVSTQLGFFDHIVACGLADKGTTSMHREGFPLTINQVTQTFVEILAKHFDLEVTDSGYMKK